MSDGKKVQNTKFWDMKMSAGSTTSADIFIYGDIVRYPWDDSDTSALTFKTDLDALGEVSTINLYINSPGGSVFEGVAIYNMLKRHKAQINVHVDGLAASIASVIAMAGDTINMPKNSMLMVHNPWTFAIGNSAELRKVADDLDRIGQSVKQSYLQKAGDKLDETTLQELLDGETWLSADEAHGHGLCDVVLEASQVSASISGEWYNRYKNVPKMLKKQPNMSENGAISPEEMAIRQKIAEEVKASSEHTKFVLGELTR